jgi:tRNA dimethylallyltransferase
MEPPRAIEVIALFGPTASGKTAVAEALAGALTTEVVSADALQVYRGLPILTNQPRRPTRLVAIRDLGETMSVGEYGPLAHAAIDDVVAQHGVVVVAGGSGLYLRAALAELDVPPAPAPGVRGRIEREVDGDPEGAHRRLEALDPAAAALVHPNDTRRVVRALELAEAGATLAPPQSRLWADDARRPTMVFGLDVPEGELEARIAARAEAMFAAGVADEVREAIAGSVSRTAEAALGLREIATLDHGEALDRIVVRTRRYAAYQRKWMRRIPGLVEIDGRAPAAEIAAEILVLAGASPR